jgi:hypothetical protein
MLTFARLNPGGYDLQIYREMARLALEGSNPYAHRYADFPPFKMLLFTLVERVGAWHGFLITLAVLHLSVLLVFLIRQYKTDEAAIWLGIVGALAPGVFLVNWYQVFEDKVIYVILMLALLLVIPDFHLRDTAKVTSTQRWKFGLSGLILGILQAYGGGQYSCFRYWHSGLLSNRVANGLNRC